MGNGLTLPFSGGTSDPIASAFSVTNVTVTAVSGIGGGVPVEPGISVLIGVIGTSDPIALDPVTPGGSQITAIGVQGSSNPSDINVPEVSGTSIGVQGT